MENSNTLISGSECSSKNKLTRRQEERMERNRQKALLLRKSRLASESDLKRQSCKEQIVKLPPKIQNSGGGFLLEECGDDPLQSKTIYIQKPPLVEEDTHHCEKCEVKFLESFLLTNFDVYICDNCRENDGSHKLITKTDAKREYLLKDCDLDKREPALKYIVKKNPHYSRGDMKLYLKCQVEERANLVWESEKNLEDAREQRIIAGEKRKQKAYDKKIKALRTAVRASPRIGSPTGHRHRYGEERSSQDDDQLFHRVCQTCGHLLTYEKM